MHLGLMAFDCGWARAQEAMEVQCGQFEDPVALAPGEWIRLPMGVDALHVAEAEGRTYVLDPAMVLSANPDFVMWLCTQLNCLVVGAGAETVSGSFWLTAADRGILRRLHWDDTATLMRPFDLGDRLESKSTKPLSQPDGEGIRPAIASLGFDSEVYLHASDGVSVIWSGEKFPASGELEAMVDSHVQASRRTDADEWGKHIAAVPRPEGGFDLRVQRPGQGEKGVIKRLFRRN